MTDLQKVATLVAKAKTKSQKQSKETINKVASLVAQKRQQQGITKEAGMNKVAVSVAQVAKLLKYRYGGDVSKLRASMNRRSNMVQAALDLNDLKKFRSSRMLFGNGDQSRAFHRITQLQNWLKNGPTKGLEQSFKRARLSHKLQTQLAQAAKVLAPNKNLLGGAASNISTGTKQLFNKDTLKSLGGDISAGAAKTKNFLAEFFKDIAQGARQGWK